jgi:hypothetical protein
MGFKRRHCKRLHLYTECVQSTYCSTKRRERVFFLYNERPQTQNEDIRMYYLKSPLHVSTLMVTITVTKKGTIELVYASLYDDFIGLDPFPYVLQPVIYYYGNKEM